MRQSFGSAKEVQIRCRTENIHCKLPVGQFVTFQVTNADKSVRCQCYWNPKSTRWEIGGLK